MKAGKILLPVLLAATFSTQAADASGGQSKKILSSKVNPLMTVRLNDRVTVMNHIVYEDGQNINRWDGFDCSTNKAVRLYWDMLDDKENVVRRFYGKSFDRYAAPQPNGDMDEFAPALCQSPHLKNISWVYIEKTSEYNTPILLDTASLIHVKDLLIAKIGFEYDEIQYDPPYDAPYDMKMEVHAYNCATQQDSVLAGLDIAPDGYVSDSLSGQAALRRTDSFTNTAATTAAFKTLCTMDNPSAFKGEGRYVSSGKKKAVSSTLGPMLPDFSHNNPQWLSQFPLPPEIEKQALETVNPWATPRFKKMTWTMLWSDTEAVPMELDVQADGLMLLLEDYKMFKTQRLTMGNLGQLKSGISLGSDASLTHEVRSTLRFPLHQGQKFTYDTVAFEKGKEDKKAVINRQCEVVGSDEARQIHSALSGRYWKVACDIEMDGKDRKQTLAWLTDFNVFMPLTQPGKGKEEPVTINDLQIVR